MNTLSPLSRRTGAALVLVLTLTPALAAAAEEKPPLQSHAVALFGSLTPEQRGKALLPYESPERNAEVYTGGPRAGVHIKDLSADQQKLAMTLLTAFCSDYGKEKAVAIADQPSNTNDPTTGFARYYLCFFGEPGEGKTYAWRIAEHHLTIVHLEVEKGEPKRFGPILLGANPPTLWDEEEDAMIALYGSLSEPERKKASRAAPSIASKPMEGEGVLVGELSPTAQEKVKSVYEGRMKFYGDAVRKRVEQIVESNGGLRAMRVAFNGAADKRCRDGGKWDFKLGGENFLCDYENQRRHIHLSMKGTLAQPK